MCRALEVSPSGYYVWLALFIAGWSLSSRMSRAVALDAFHMAVDRRQP